MNANHMSLSEVVALCPAVLADDAHSSRSKRYGFVPTLPVLEALYGAGFVATSARQTGSAARRGHGQHLVRLSQQRDLEQGGVGGVVPQVLLRNSHDGTSSLFLAGGLFRFACFNGLVIGEVWAQMKLRHTRQLVSEAIEGSFEIVRRAEETRAVALEWQGVLLDAPERKAYAGLAMGLRMGNRPGWDPEQLLTVRRFEDEPTHLWAVFNRAQENGTNGGFHGVMAGGQRQTARPLGEIDREVAFNRDLWRMSAAWAQGGFDAARRAVLEKHEAEVVEA